MNAQNPELGSPAGLPAEARRAEAGASAKAGTPDSEPLSDRKLAAILVGISFLARFSVYLGSYIFGTDGAQMLHEADAFYDGRFGEGLAIEYHPLFPLLTSFVKPFLGSEHGGMWVSVILGSVAVAPLFLLARETLGRPAAFLGGMLYAFHPGLVEVQSDVMTEGAFCFFFIGSIWLAWETIKEPRWSWAILAGAAAAGAYMTRPEGILAVVGIPCWLATWALKGRPAVRFAHAAIVVVVAVLLAFPYLLWARNHSGHWTISAKDSAQKVQGYKAPASRQEYQHGELQTREPLKEMFSHFMRVTSFVFAPLLVLGLFSLRRNWLLPYYFSFPVSYWAAITLSTAMDPWTSNRYLLPGVAFFLPLVAAGLIQIFVWLKRIQWLPVAAVLVVVGLWASTIRPVRTEARAVRAAAAWLAAEAGPDAVVATSNGALTYLAGTRWISMPPIWEKFEVDCDRYDYVAFLQLDIDHHRLNYVERINERYGPPRKVFEAPNSKVYVYKLR